MDGPESYVGPDRAVLENIKKYNDEALVAAHMGFVVDTTPIANEIAACSSVEVEYTSRLNTGQLASQEDVNKTLDEFIEKLKANGFRIACFLLLLPCFPLLQLPLDFRNNFLRTIVRMCQAEQSGWSVVPPAV